MTETTTTRSTRGEVGNRLSDGERLLLRHWSMWGSAMYPVRSTGRGQWILDEVHGVTIPGVFGTKKAATAAFERFVDVLIDAAGQEAFENVAAR